MTKKLLICCFSITTNSFILLKNTYLYNKNFFNMKNLNTFIPKFIHLPNHVELFTFQNQYVIMDKETDVIFLWGDSTNDILNLQPLEPLLINAIHYRVKNVTDPTSRSVLMIVVGEMYGKLFCVRKHVNNWEFGLYDEICELWR